MDQQIPPTGGYQPPQPPPPPSYGGYMPPPSGGSAIGGKVAGPAITIMILAGVTIAFSLLRLLLLLLFPDFAQRFGGGGDDMAALRQIGEKVGVFVVLSSLLINVIAFVGALKMKSLQSHTLAMVSAILIMIPCNCPCCILGIPAGIWALVVLMNPDVKAAFR